MQPFLQHWLTQILYGIPNVLTALLIFVASIYLARLLSTLVRRFLARRRMVADVVELLARALYWIILLLGIVMALERFFDVTAFLAGLGIVGFTVGFALQDVMKNFAAGIILLLQQPFRIGEAISVAGFDGTILAMDLRATEMSTFDGRLVSIPNATILTNPIINYTRAPRRRVDITLPVESSGDLEGVRKLVLEAMRAAPGSLSDPAPVVGVEQITAGSVNLLGQFWVDVSKSNPDVSRDAALSRIRADLVLPSASTAATAASAAPRSDGKQAG